MTITPINHEGYRLLHEGVVALADVEAYGMRVDVPYLQKALEQTGNTMLDLKRQMRETEIWKLWRKRHGAKASPTNREQFADIIYNALGYPVTERTDSGAPSTDASALEKVDRPEVKLFLQLMKLDKANGTYLRGILREVVDDRLHPVFNLHTVLTYRSSSDSPNFQNMPVRDPEVAKLIRRAFIPSKGCVIVENDYAGIEVKIAACYHKDPVMLSYIRDTTKDMHRDMAAQIYCLEPDWVKQFGKNHRYGAKNKFVFPQFYGDYYLPCARNLWEWMVRAKLEGPDKISLQEHLLRHGIKKLGALDPEKKPLPGTFEKHLQDVENDFWNNRFRVYGKWKRKWYSRYLETGGFDTLTGFRLEGTMLRNEVINYPVQGSAFHCLLWSLIRINKLLKKYKMKTRIAGQIHDSLISDVRVEELSDYLALVRQVMTEDIKKAWDWIIVPLDIENEICAPDGTWFDKQAVEFKDSIYGFTPKDAKEPLLFDTSDKFLSFLSQQLNQKKAA